MDILKYKPVIDNVLSNLKVPRSDREDLTQECYLMLLENLKEGDTDGYAYILCRRRVVELWRKDIRSEGKIHIDSMTDPRIAHKVSKIAALDELNLADEVLYGALDSLPLDEYRVIHNLFVEGRTQEQTAADLGLTRSQVRTKSEHGIAHLKKYFEIE